MPRTRKFIVFSLAGVGILMALLLTAGLTAHLLANRGIVKSFIVTKTAQATGGDLVYDRLDIGFFPFPHLKARNIDLRRQDAFDIAALELSVYLRILPLVKGRVSIYRLAMATPSVRMHIGSGPMAVSPEKKESDLRENGLKTLIEKLFGALASIDPGTDLQIDDGTLTLVFADAPDFQISAIDAAVGNDNGNLLLDLRCRSEMTGNLNASASADIETMQARGRISIGDINVHPLLLYASLPGGLTTEDTRASANASFTVTGPKRVSGQFDLRCPSLTIKRGDQKLDMDTIAISGSADYAEKGLSISIDTLQAARPALDLSAAASFRPTNDPGRSVVELKAATGELDVAVAGTVSRAVAGDLDAIRTAFSVARQGKLTDAVYFAGFEVDESGWHLTKMKAAGHLAQGLITIPGIDADLERMDGDVIYEDQHVAFKNVSGHFKGATFQQLDAAIDWEQVASLSISSPSVEVDVTHLFTWLTAFEGLSDVKKVTSSVQGSARLSTLQIDGPLTRPVNWQVEIVGTPEKLKIASPLVPFEIGASDGTVSYTPGEEVLEGVNVDFLDSSLVASYQSKGIVSPESVVTHIDGTLGKEALAWLMTILPIPEHLQIKPPVDLSGVEIAWDNTQNAVSFIGGIKTAGDVALFTDVTRYPDALRIRNLRFSDGRSKATVSALIQGDALEVTFSGNVEGQTADRLLRDNRTLSGRLKGDFRIVIDSAAPLNSTFAGKLSGEGLHLRGIVRDPIELKQFAIESHDNRLKIAPSKISLLNSLMVVDGFLKRSDGSLLFDLNVKADRLDEALIRALQPAPEVNAPPIVRQEPPATLIPRGNIHLNATDFTFNRFTWSPLEAEIKIEDDQINIRVDEAKLCGISTTGTLGFSPQGTSLRITPAATDASIQETARCLSNRPVKAQAQYDLSGEISLPPTREKPVQFLSGQMEMSSENGKIEYASTLMKIFSVLNITEVFTGGKTDLTEDGYGYTKAYAKAQIADGKVLFDEILLDGNALKITGQGNILLDNLEANITLLASPLKTIDRIVNKIPIINYIAGGSLITIPLRITGPLTDVKVKPIRPSAVGQGLLDMMQRTLKAPFKLVQSTSEVVEAGLSRETPPMDDSKMNGP